MDLSLNEAGSPEKAASSFKSSPRADVIDYSALCAAKDPHQSNPSIFPCQDPSARCILRIMPSTVTILGLYKTAQISLPILKTGLKLLRDHALSSDKESEWEKGVQEVLDDQIKQLLKDKVTALSPNQLEEVEAPLVAFTGIVLQSLAKDVIESVEFASVHDLFAPHVKQLPRRWRAFVHQGIEETQPLNGIDFLNALQAAHEGRGDVFAVQPQWLAAFFSQWIRGDIGDVPWRDGWHIKLADAVTPIIANGLSRTLAADHPVALTAFRESLLHFHTELRSLVKESIAETKKQGAESAHRDGKMLEMVLELSANKKATSKEERLAAYRRALLAAFRPYQELAIDNFAGAEQSAPDIWDIFVHPACSENFLRPEEIDQAQREIPPRLPAQELLPILAQDDHRRTVLLADPGMGKSTLIQSLIAYLANGRSFVDATPLTGLLPVPLILRDLVPLLQQDKVESWTWDNLLTLLIEHYQRDEAAPPLCECYKEHRDEFRQHLNNDKAIFFLIDGLDEIGDITKRRQIVRCIQNGIREVNKEARWLITSRVIGYDKCEAHLVTESSAEPWMEDDMNSLFKDRQMNSEAMRLYKPIEDTWREYIPPNTQQMNGTMCTSITVTIAQFAKNYAIQSSNGYELSFTFPILKCLYLAPFDDKRQDLFTQRWFQHRHGTDHSKELMREVRAHHHDGVRIISRVPNLLCMMNILKRSGKPLPDGRAALYEDIVKAYLGGIDAAYRLRPVLGNNCPFDAMQRRFLLALLGAHMQQTRTSSGITKKRSQEKNPGRQKNSESEGNILISRPELEQLLLPVIQRMCNEGRVMSKHDNSELLNELLRHIASRSGLLIPRSSDEKGNTLYGFTHLSFLEFFAAEWLSSEFDRNQRQLARQFEALQDGQTVTNAELEQLFPAVGPITHDRASFRNLPPLSAWHEPLIFLLETRKADTPTLLRWLFPMLHSTKPDLVSVKNQSGSRLLPLEAVRLAVKLAQDPEIPLLPETRCSWWRILWQAYLRWPYSPQNPDTSKRWLIAPELLGRVGSQAEVLQALHSVLSELPPAGSGSSGYGLWLDNCITLTELPPHISGSGEYLTLISLSGCTALTRLPDLRHMTNLKYLYLDGCTKLISKLEMKKLVPPNCAVIWP